MKSQGKSGVIDWNSNGYVEVPVYREDGPKPGEHKRGAFIQQGYTGKAAYQEPETPGWMATRIPQAVGN